MYINSYVDKDLLTHYIAWLWWLLFQFSFHNLTLILRPIIHRDHGILISSLLSYHLDFLDSLSIKSPTTSWSPSEFLLGRPSTSGSFETTFGMIKPGIGSGSEIKRTDKIGLAHLGAPTNSYSVGL